MRQQVYLSNKINSTERMRSWVGYNYVKNFDWFSVYILFCLAAWLTKWLCIYSVYTLAWLALVNVGLISVLFVVKKRVIADNNV